MSELDRLRQRFGGAMLGLLWLHVPLIAITAHLLDRSPVAPVIFSASLVIVFHLAWRKLGISPVTRCWRR